MLWWLPTYVYITMLGSYTVRGADYLINYVVMKTSIMDIRVQWNSL